MSVYDFTYTSIEGKPVPLADYKGQVLLIVNTASKCGFTPQLKGLEALYQAYKDRGFAVIGFPCNQFGGQEPEDEKGIQAFCSLRYGVTFPLSQKVEVNGENALPLYKYLTAQEGDGVQGQGVKAKLMELALKARQSADPDENRIQWNFTKFLIDRQGDVVARFEPSVEPKDIAPEIEKLL